MPWSGADGLVTLLVDVDVAEKMMIIAAIYIYIPLLFAKSEIQKPNGIHRKCFDRVQLTSWGLGPENEKEGRQSHWQNGKVNVLCLAKGLDIVIWDVLVEHWKRIG